MKRALLITFMIVLLSQICFASADSYSLDIAYDNGKLSLDNLKIAPDSNYENSGMYIAELVSFDYDILNDTFFDIPNQMIYEGEFNNSVAYKKEVNLSNVNFTINIPYYDNAKEIVLYDSSFNELLRVDVSKFSKNLCGDSICQSWEVGKCSDCEKAEVPAGTPSKGISEALGSIGGISLLVIAIIVLAVILVVMIILLLTRKKKEKTYEFISPS